MDFLFLSKKKDVDIIILWGGRYIFLTYIASVFMVTDAYKVFVEGIPTFFMEANLIPFFNTIRDIFINICGSVFGYIIYNVTYKIYSKLYSYIQKRA